MPLFISDEEFSLCSHDAKVVADIADAFIIGLQTELDAVKEKANTASIMAEKNQMEMLESMDLDKGHMNDKLMILRLNKALKNRTEKLKIERTLAVSSKIKFGYLTHQHHKEIQYLSKQLELAKQGGKESPSAADIIRDTKIQTLVDVLEKTRECLKEERAKQKMIIKSYDNVGDYLFVLCMQRSKLMDELENHKQAVKATTDEIEKLKNDQGNQLELPPPPEMHLEDLTHSYLEAVDNFELAAQPTTYEHGLTAAYSEATYTLRSTVELATGGGVPLSDISGILDRGRRLLPITMEEQSSHVKGYKS